MIHETTVFSWFYLTWWPTQECGTFWQLEILGQLLLWKSCLSISASSFVLVVLISPIYLRIPIVAVVIIIVAIIVVTQIILLLGLLFRNWAIIRGRVHTTLQLMIEDQHGWTSLKTWIPSLARPITVAGFSQTNIPIGIVLAQCYKRHKAITFEISPKRLDGRCTTGSSQTATYDAFGIQLHFEANHKHESLHCREVLQCRTAPWRFRSSKSSTACKTFRVQKYHTTNRNARCWCEDLLTQEGIESGAAGMRFLKDIFCLIIIYLGNAKVSKEPLQCWLVSWPFLCFLPQVPHTCQILIFTNGRISPRIITPIRYASVFSNPHKSIGTIVKLLIALITLPISVTISGIRDGFRFDLTRVLLLHLDLGRR